MEEQENVNTKKKALYNVKLFIEFLASGDERKNSYPELQSVHD